MVASDTSYETILSIVRAWPEPERLSLVQDVMQTLADEKSAARHPTLEQALGLLATDRPPPTDEEIEQWLDERRTRRYG